MKPSRVVLFLPVILLVALALLRTRAEGPLVGEPAPDFALPIAHGEGASTGDRVRLSDLRGQFVVLDFWASWCGPCKESVPILNQVARELHGEGVRVYGINTEAYQADALASIARRWAFAYPVLQDPGAELQLAYQISALPTLLLVDRAGVVRGRHAGAPSAEHLIRQVRELNH